MFTHRPRCSIISQDIYVGYRNYGKDLEPLFAFGHGLSYSTFEYSDLYATPPSFKDTFNVSFTVKNTGDFAGSEVAQVYIADPVSTLPRPAKELKGFTKVYLEKNESKTVNIELGRDAISFYDDRKKTWIAEEGIFEVQVAASSRPEDIRLRKNVSLGKTFTWNGLWNGEKFAVYWNNIEVYDVAYFVEIMLSQLLWS